MTEYISHIISLFYPYDKNHLSNINLISKIIIKGSFQELLFYKNFHLETLLPQIEILLKAPHHILIHIFNNCTDISILNKVFFVHYLCAKQIFSVELFDCLIQKGVYLDELDPDNFEPIHYACSCGSYEMIDYLISRKAARASMMNLFEFI